MDLTDQQACFAMPSLNRSFQQKHLDLVREASGCWLIVRGEYQFALDLPVLLEDQLHEKIEFRLIPNERMPWSRVHLFRVRTMPNH